jgi:deoxyuridine 5'-triphosphate nucleotidohydrolase
MKLLVQKIDPSAVLPSYAYDGDAGMDLFSLEDIAIPPGEKVSVRTGLKFAIPKGFAGFVWDKSGIATKHHLKTMAGVIDSNYRGELLVVLTNLGRNYYLAEKGSKIAQLVIKPVASLEIEEGEVSDDTERGARGFGSSGSVSYAGSHPTAVEGVPSQFRGEGQRPSWDEYFMMAAKLVATMATCPKLHVGTVIVKNRRIISSGFNGAPPGYSHCTEVGCLHLEGEGTSCRRVVHSEHNAVLQDSRNVSGGSLYTSYLPCIDCMKAIISAGVSEVVYEREYKDKPRYQISKQFAIEGNIKLRKIPEVNIVKILARYYNQEA